MKTVQMTLDEHLVKAVDSAAKKLGTTRSGFTREALRSALKEVQAKELDRLYMEGHRSQPEDLDWAESAARLLSKRLPKEKW